MPSPYKTAVLAFRRSNRRLFSRRSARPTAAPIASTAVRVWACQFHGISPDCWVAMSRCRVRRGRAVSSRSRFRCSTRGRAAIERSSQTGVSPAPTLLQPEPPPAARAPTLSPAFNFAQPPLPIELTPSLVEDDRARIAADSRNILIVEDDLRFAAILRDLARELGFYVHRHANGRRRAGRRAEIQGARDHSGHESPRSLGPRGSQRSQAQPDHASHSGARGIGRGLQPGGAQSRRGRLRTEAREARAVD